MRVTIRLFAVLRDLAQIAELQLDLAERTPVSNAIETLATRYPRLQPMLSRSAAAINRAYAKPDDELHDGDELALIPPVSGGC